MEIFNEIDIFDNEWIDYELIEENDSEMEVEYSSPENEAEDLITYYSQKYGSERFAK